MRLFRGPLVAACLSAALMACTTIPPSSLTQLAMLNPLTMKPAEIRVVVTFPDAIRLKPGDVVMDVGWKNAGTGAVTKRHFALEMVTGNAAAPQIGRMLGENERLYLLMLKPTDAESFQAMQGEVLAARRAGESGSGSISVGFAGGCTADPAIKRGPVLTSVLLRPEGEAAYLPIYDHMDLMTVLRSAGLSEVPVCAGDGGGPVSPGPRNTSSS